MGDTSDTVEDSDAGDGDRDIELASGQTLTTSSWTHSCMCFLSTIAVLYLLLIFILMSHDSQVGIFCCTFLSRMRYREGVAAVGGG